MNIQKRKFPPPFRCPHTKVFGRHWLPALQFSSHVSWCFSRVFRLFPPNISELLPLCILRFLGTFLRTLSGNPKVLQSVSVRVDWVIKCSLFQLQWQGFTSSPLLVINYSFLIIDTWFILYSIYLSLFQKVFGNYRLLRKAGCLSSPSSWGSNYPWE